MNKYLLTIATEAEGHASSIACYFQTKDDLTKPQVLLQAQRIYALDGDTYFQENENTNPDAADNGVYYGNWITKINDFTYETPTSIVVTKLPSRVSTNKLYVIETSTG